MATGVAFLPVALHHAYPGDIWTHVLLGWPLPPLGALTPLTPAQVGLMLAPGGWTTFQKRAFLGQNHIKQGGTVAELNERLEPFLVCIMLLVSC